MTFQTEFDISLPKGYVDEEGTLHKNGIMRLATAADEILSEKDIRVQSNPSYITIIILSRVITKLGSLQSVNPKVIESLFISDLVYLKTLYEKINGDGTMKIAAKCPKCENKFDVELKPQE